MTGQVLKLQTLNFFLSEVTIYKSVIKIINKNIS